MTLRVFGCAHASQMLAWITGCRKRIQFGAFFGKMNRNRRQELALRLRNELGRESGRVRIIPVCEQDLKDMWVLDQYRRDADQLKAEAEERDREKPRLKVLGAEWTNQ